MFLRNKLEHICENRMPCSQICLSAIYQDPEPIDKMFVSSFSYSDSKGVNLLMRTCLGTSILQNAICLSVQNAFLYHTTLED